MTTDIWAESEKLRERLDAFIQDVERLTEAALERNDIPAAVVHYAQVRDAVANIRAPMTRLGEHEDLLSYEILPTMFDNQHVKSLRVENIGNVSVVDRWSASMINKARGLIWLRETGNEGLIIETVNASTLGAFAKDRVREGDPLPGDIFTVKATPHVSIRK